MTSTGYKFAHYQILGNPSSDWSHASSYLANLYREQLLAENPDEFDHEEVDRFEQGLIKARGVDDLSEEDLALAQDLAAADGVDISNFPGGSNYSPSMVSSTNPLGLPGDLWGLVTEASEGALVAALMRTTSDGELEIKFPGGYDWQPLTDPTVISDYNIVGVMPEAIDLFNNYDRDNTLGVVGSYWISDTGPFPTREQLEIPMPTQIPTPRAEDDEFWERSGQTYGGERPVQASAVLNSVEDLDEAILAAVDDPDLRWYVERRVTALGLEASLPWQKD